MAETEHKIQTKLLKDAYSKAKDCASVDFACADISCPLCL